MKIVFCGFGNPDNRGCEAIIRTTSEMTRIAFPESEIIATSNDYGITPMVDLDTINKYEYSYYPHEDQFDKYIYAGFKKLFGTAYGWCKYKNASAYRRIGRADMCISVGGDNFCYGNSIDHFLVHHDHYKKNGAKLVHWGTSFENDLMPDKLIKDLNNFDAIMVRESLSYNTLKNRNITSPLYLIPDPAFTMIRQEPIEMPKLETDCVGLNVSPMVVSKESQNGIVLKNTINLVDFITEQGKQVVLIPHVCNRANGHGDYSVMKALLDEVKHPERCLLVGYKYTAPEIKYIISECSMFIGARTHATIAAYSTCVPTAVIGYSVKAKGIATDLFGTDDNYVLPVQQLKNENEFIVMYRFLEDNKSSIRQKLTYQMPEYIKLAGSAIDILHDIVEK